MKFSDTTFWQLPLDVVDLIFVILSKFYKFTRPEDVLGHVVLY